MSVLMQAPDGTTLDCPEAMMVVRSDAPPGVPADAVACAVSRAQSILVLVMDQFSSKDAQTFSHDVICNSLWAVEGILSEINAMVMAAHDREMATGKIN